MYEIEIKSLLGNKERAEALKRHLVQLFPALRPLPPHKQRNFYFSTPAELHVIESTIKPLLSKEKQTEFSNIIKQVKNGPGRGNRVIPTSNGAGVSIRTRDADGKSLFIMKASIGDDTSANGVSRIEFEEEVALSFDELNERLIGFGLSYQAKWSREREQYNLGSIHITIDKNAGYGYVAEFEKMLDNEQEATRAKVELRALMAELDCKELPQDRLERMFTYYNAHWQEFYGTDKVFVIE